MIRLETKLETKNANEDDSEHFDAVMEVKLLKPEADAEDGVFEGYASVFNLMDRGGDIILPKAFKASLAEWKKKKAMPAMLWNHQSWGDQMPIGRWLEIAEDDVGLRVKGSLNIDVDEGRKIYSHLKHGSISAMSIGWICRDHDYDRTTGVRNVKRADLVEISLVGVPMLDEARVVGVKQFGVDARRLERELKSELNLSNSDAVTAVAIVKKHLREGDRKSDAPPSSVATDLILTLRKAGMALRG